MRVSEAWKHFIITTAIAAFDLILSQLFSFRLTSPRAGNKK
jgi:hypothetical protein